MNFILIFVPSLSVWRNLANRRPDQQFNAMLNLMRWLRWATISLVTWNNSVVLPSPAPTMTRHSKSLFCWMPAALRLPRKRLAVTPSRRSCNHQPRPNKRILWLRLRPLIPSLHLGLSAKSWILPPSAPAETLNLAASPGSLVPPTYSPLVSHYSDYTTDLRALRYAQFLHPYGNSGFLLPSGSASVLGHSCSTSDARGHNSA